MRGHIVKRSKNKNTWSIVISDRDDTGKRKQHWVTFEGSKREAEKHLNELLHQMDNGIFIKPSKQTLADYLISWLQDTAYPNMSRRTYEGYEYMVQKHIIPAIGQIPLTQLKPQHIQHLYSELLTAGKARTCEYCHFTLRKALRDAVRMAILSHNPSDPLKRPKIQHREMQVMSDKDVHLFLELAKETMYYALFYTLIFTGLRRNEALALRWSDVDLLLCQLSVNRTLLHSKGQVEFKQPKTAKARRVIALSPSTVEVLRERREAQENLRQSIGLPEITDSGLVFCHYDGKPYHPDTISHAWLKLSRKLGINVRLHDARHTHASLMLKAGVHPKIVQERLGHATITTTLDTYSHVVPSLQQAAANRFDDILMPKEDEVASKVKLG